MKILVIPSWYPSKSYPNNGSFFREQSEALRASGIDVDTFVVEVPYRNTKKDFDYFSLNKYTENGMEVYRVVYPIGFLRRLPSLFYRVIIALSVKFFEKNLYNEKYDAIIAHSSICGGYIANEIGSKFNIPVITIEHSSKIITNQLDNKEKSILNSVVENSDKFICVSENLKDKIRLQTSSKSNIIVHPNMVSSIFYKGPKKDNVFEIVSVGNLIPLKEMDKLIDGFYKAFSDNENVYLTIIGDGPEYGHLENLINNYKMEKRILLKGRLDRKSVAKYLSESNVMALISSHETFGIAYVEALISGNVILGFKNGGANDIINDTNGLLIDNNDSQSVADALLSIYNNYEMYNLDEISQNANSIYNEKSFAEFYINLLNMLVNKYN